MEPAPAEIAIVNDYEVVVRGVAAMLAPYDQLVRVVELDLNRSPTQPLDLALFDTFAAPQEGEGDVLAALVERSAARRVVVYSWYLDPVAVQSALTRGAAGYLSKALPGRELAGELVRIHEGEVVVSPPLPTGAAAIGPDVARPISGGHDSGTATGNGTGTGTRGNGNGSGRTWPGRDLGLTERESELLALAVQGHGNADIARLLYLSPNSVKTHARNLYRKIGVSNRTQAVLWGIGHGFAPDRGVIRTGAAGPAPGPSRAAAGMQPDGAAS